MLIRVFYNKSCKICNIEISHYQKYCNKKILWENIVDNEEARRITKKTYEQLIRRIHVIKNGKIYEGVNAFMQIWKILPKYHFLYKLLKVKPIFLIFHVIYEILAYFLFMKNKHLLKK